MKLAITLVHTQQRTSLIDFESVADTNWTTTLLTNGSRSLSANYKTILEFTFTLTYYCISTCNISAKIGPICVYLDGAFVGDKRGKFVFLSIVVL